MNQLDFRGRTAVVTGGAQGIGFAIAERLAKSGGSVRIWDLDSARLLTALDTLGGSTTSDTVDVTDENAVARATKKAISDLGKIDILINNAGIAGINKPTIEY